MSALRELQTGFRDAVLHGGASPTPRTIAADGLAPAARLAIHRHHVVSTLTDVLRATFPVVCRLVDERFFVYAAADFIAISPPTSPCLHEYGDAFPGFLAAFPPCRALPYLPDVARLEWAMSRAEHADDAPPLDPRALAGISADEWGDLRLAFHPSLALLASPWPVDRIWRANRQDADGEETVDLDAGGVHLEVRRHHDAIVWRRLDAGSHRLRQELHAGRTLGEAVGAALGDDPRLDLAVALSELIHDDTVVAFTLTPRLEDD